MFIIKNISIKSNTNSRNIITFNKYFNEYKSKENIEKRNEINSNLRVSEDRIQSPQQYCIDCVKKYDFENYLSTILLKESSIRRNSFAIKAFNAELSQIRDLTSNELMAQIRLQYWSDLIDQIFADDSMVLDFNQPIAYELQKCERSGKVAKHWFKKLIDSRMDAKNLSQFPFQTLPELEKYSDSSVTPVYYLIVECSTRLHKVSANERIDLDHICSHLGRAVGLSNVLRGIVHNSRHNRCYIPSDLLIKHKTSHEDFLRNTPTTQVCDLCFELATIANQNIETAFNLMKRIDKQNRLIFLPLISVHNYLNRLQKCNFNVFDPKLRLRNGFLPTILWFKSKLL